MTQSCISQFNKQYRWLSNFSPCVVELDGAVYSSVEHAYQAAKTLDRADRAVIGSVNTTAAMAKKLGKYVFVHGGVPVNTLAEDVCGINWHQFDHTCEHTHPLWMRDSFLNNHAPRPNGTVVVHGHTPTRGQPEVTINRINVDTGSCFGGRLSMVELMDDQLRFHSQWGAWSG